MRFPLQGKAHGKWSILARHSAYALLERLDADPGTVQFHFRPVADRDCRSADVKHSGYPGLGARLALPHVH